MKKILTILILISSLTSFGQSETVFGDYSRNYKTNDNNIFEYKLTLSQDGTFSFHYYSNLKQRTPQEENKSAKGKWEIKDNVISFFSEKKTNTNEKDILDFTNSKARFFTKSPRNKTDQIIKTRIQFLKSDIFWMEKIEMFKI
ncbi:hypothetical protein [Flavobacterium aquiphilum]|uniref:hypothetical protein n=1 Tax=Flavobacterium aquiphilum TaxID=3003261 RepID=UPI002480EFD9|nr:hypothetical protein [Flavobacterium aquiphilum]